MAESDNIGLPPTIEPEQEIPEIAERIMLAAVHLFGRKGYAATSVREIVQEANVTNPMLYYYFDSKEGLFRRLMEFLFEYMQLRIARIVGDDDLDFEEKVHAIVTTHLDGVRDSPEVLRFIYAAIFGPVESRPDIDVHAIHMRTHKMITEMFTRAIESGEFEPEPGLDVDHLAAMFLGSINQELMRVLDISRMATSTEEAEALLELSTNEAAVDRICAFFFGGVGTIRKETPS